MKTAIRRAMRIRPAVLDLTLNASSGANQGSRHKACEPCFQSVAHFGAQPFFNQ